MNLTSDKTSSNEERTKKLFNYIETKHLNEEEAFSLMNILANYNDIFYLEGDKLTHTNTIMHEIPLTNDAKTVNIKPYRLPLSQREEINKQMNKMLEEGIIQNSNSAWNSPLLVVPKKSTTDEKKFRVVVDYRKLNEVSIGDCYPIPNITEILDQLGKSNYFSTLDMASSYHQILIDPRDKHLTAFNAGSSGHYEFNRLPFGLKNAPSTFGKLMNVVMSGLQNISCLIYLDDIVVYGHDLKEHNDRLLQVFDRLVQHNLKLQPEKCHFLRKEIIYLGHLITDKGIKPDPSKTAVIDKYPIPKHQRHKKLLRSSWIL